MSSSGVILLNLENRNAAEFESILVPGSYDKALGAATAGSYITVYKWLYNGFAMTASLCTAENKTEYISLVDKTNGGELRVYSDDTISLLGGVTPSVLTTLDVSENGMYLPPEGYNGFSQVDVDVEASLTTLEASANGTYLPPEGYDGFSQVNVSVDTPVVQLKNPYIDPIYKGLSTAYNAINGSFYEGPSKTQYLNFYEIDSGTYCVFVGQTIGTRFRALFFANKNFSDFSPYLDDPQDPAVPIFQADLNITGSTELTGGELQRRIFFTVETPGTLVVGTDNASNEIPSMLFKIVNQATRTFRAYHITSGSTTSPYSLMLQKGHFVGTEFDPDWDPADMILDGEPIEITQSMCSGVNTPYLLEGCATIAYINGWIVRSPEFAHEWMANSYWAYYFPDTLLHQWENTASAINKYFCEN